MKNVILFFFSLAIVLCLLEFLTRVLNLAPPSINYIGCFRLVENPKMMYELVPGSKVDGGVVNKQGFKNKNDFIKEKSKNTIRIAMLGDSITQGPFVPLGKTFSEQLEQLLNQEASTEKSDFRYEVMNFGIAGYNLEAEVETLKLKVLQYFPDIVVLNLFHNDNDPIPNLGAFFKDSNYALQKDYLFRKYVYNHNSPAGVFMRRMLYKSKFYILLRERLVNLNKEMHDIAALGQECDVKDFGTESIYRGFSEIARLQAQYNFKFLICVHSHLLYGEHSNNKKFADIASSYRFPYFHMIEYYKKEKVSPDEIRLKDNTKDTCHPNALGHEIIAKAMFTELKKYNWLH